MKTSNPSFFAALAFSICLASCKPINTQTGKDESINLCPDTTQASNDSMSKPQIDGVTISATNSTCATTHANGGKIDIAGQSQVVRTTVSTAGSTRATAYQNGNKIITKDGKTFITWLDHVGELVQIKVKSYDGKSRKWSDSVTVGTGNDSHAGGVLTMDKAGYIHIVYGAHHEKMKYSRTVRPLDISAWIQTGIFGSAKDTYPSLVTAPDDTLWCATRSSATDPWRLRIYRKPPDMKWDSGLDILEVGDMGYAQVGNSLAVGADGTIHVGILIYTTKSDGGRMVGYLRSRDAGKTWENAEGHILKIPATPESDCFIEQGKTLDMRIGNIALDPGGNPWMTVSHLEEKPITVVLRHYENNQWQSINLLPVLQKAMPNRNISEAGVSFDRNGTLYVSCSGGEGIQWWGSPKQEVIMLKSQDKGRNFDVTAISKFNAAQPSWLQSIERPFSGQLLDKAPSVIFTSGVPGDGVRAKDQTDVVFASFDE